MRKVCILLTGMVLTLLFTACKQFTADIDEYLNYWASEAFIKSAGIEAATQTDETGIASVASEKDVTVTLKLQNPRSLKLVMPSASETRNIVHFEHFTEAKPAAGTDYELKQLEGDTLQLIYKAGFLKNHEWGEKDLSSIITLIADDGRVFKQAYTFKIKANTPPSKPDFTVAKTVGTPAYYVLCITVPNMNKKVSGGLLHKDITRIEVNETPYTFSVDEAHNTFIKPESDVFIASSAVEKLTAPDAEEVPAGGWVLYYKTDVEVKDGAAKKDYTIKLIDKKGLTSGIVSASTKPNKPTAEVLTVTKGSKASGSGAESDPVIIGSDSTGAELMISSATGGTTVHCTLTDTGSAASSQYDGNPVTVPLPLNGTAEKTYKLEYYTDGEGFASTAVKTVYYKILEGHTVTFDAKGGTPVPDVQSVMHGEKVADPSASVSQTGFYLDGWYTEEAYTHKWDFNTDTVMSNITLYAKWGAGTGTAYKVEHYQQNITNNDYTLAATDDLRGTTGENATVTLKNDPGFEAGTYTPTTIAADGSTVVKVYYKRNTVTVTFDPHGGTIGSNTSTGKYGATLTVPTPNWAGHIFSGWDPPVPATFPPEDKIYTALWDLNSYKVEFSVDGGTGGTLKATVDGSEIHSGNHVAHDKTVNFTANPDTANGWEVAGWTVSPGSFTSGGGTSTTATLSGVTTNVIDVKVKFKRTHPVTFSVDGGTGGTLKATVDSIEIYSGNKVKHDKTVNFTATPHEGYEVQSWSGGVTVKPSTDNKEATLTVTTNQTVTVTFKKKEYTVTFSVDGGTGGTLKATVDSIEIYSGNKVKHDKTVNFTATPHEGYEVQSWSGGVTVKPSTNNKEATLTVTTNQTVTVKFKVKKHAVNYSVDGGNGKIQVGSETPTTSGETQVTHNGSVTFTAKPDLGWEVDYWTSATENTPNTTATLSGVTTNGIDVKVRFKKITTVNAGDNGGKEWELLKKVVEIADNNATITINGEIKATNDTGNSGKITLTGNITIRGDSSAVLNANGLSRIFNVPNGKTLTLENITLKNGKADNGSGVYNEGTLIMKGSATVAPSAGAGKNDVYLASGAMIIVNSTLSPTDGIAAYITPGSYAEGRQVLNGSEVESEYYKFEVTPESSTAEWVIKSDGCLKKAKDVVSSSSATPWKDLKTAIISAHDGDIIVINGEIKATDAPDNNGGITINKSITIKGKNKDTAILNANKNENNKFTHYIFFVNGDRTVTLQNLTLTGGINDNSNGGAIHIGASTRGNTVKMINCIIKDNAATGDGGGVYIGSNGTFTMDGESSSITGNQAVEGGAIYIDDEGDFYWQKGTITSNGGSNAVKGDGTFHNNSGNTAN